MSDYLIEMRVKNNNLLRKIEECGYTSIGDFCRRNEKLGWSSTIGEFANLKKSPLNRYGVFLPIVEEMCKILLCSPEDIFSEVQMTTALESNRRTLQVNEAEMAFMLANQKDNVCMEDQLHNNRLPDKIDEILRTLTPREQKIITLRFGINGNEEHNLESVAKLCDVTRERIRQIEAKALHKLRHPIRKEIVEDYLE